jgi:hypothetical protein
LQQATGDLDFGCAFTEGMPKTSNTEVTSQTKTAKLKAA